MIASVTLSIILSQSPLLVGHKGLHLLSEKIVIFENLSLPDSSIKINGLVRTISLGAGLGSHSSFPMT